MEQTLMSEQSLPEPAPLVQLCTACGRFAATLLAPPDLFSGGSHVCELCAEQDGQCEACQPYGPAAERRPFLWVDVDFFELVAPLLSAVELRTYLGAVRLCDGHRGPSSLSKLARAAAVSRRNVVDAIALLERVGLVCKGGRYGPKGTRYLLVRPHLIGMDPGRPCLVRAAVYQDAKKALSVIRGSPVDPLLVIRGSPDWGSGDHQSSDPGITKGLSPMSTGHQHTNHHADRSPTHPPPPPLRGGPPGRGGAPGPRGRPPPPRQPGRTTPDTS